MASPSWPPDYHIHDYKGPYPVGDLERARKVLITYMTGDKASIKLEKLKPKLGISSKFGELIPPPPLQKRKSFHDRQLSSLPSSTTSSVTSIASTKRIIVEKSVLNKEKATPKVEKAVEDEHLTKQWQIAHTLNTILPVNNLHEPGPPSRKRVGTCEPVEENVSCKKFRAPARIERKSSEMLMFNCDFCYFWAPGKAEMTEHLHESRHCSASLFNCVTEDGTYQIISVEKMVAVKNEHSINATCVVTCPTCKDVFEDIFMCGMHHKYAHDGNLYYSICEVVHHSTLLVPTEPKCFTCDVTFLKYRDLYKHFDLVVEHRPLKAPSSTEEFQLLSCPYCKKVSHGKDFKGFCMHVLLHKQDHVTSLAMNVKHVRNPTSTMTLPPFNTEEGHPDGIQQEIKVMKNLAAYLKRAGCLPGKQNIIKRKLKGLQSLVFKVEEFNTKFKSSITC